MSNHQSSDSSWVTTFVFISGFILGAGAAFLLAPETGTTLRQRIAKGAKTAQEEFANMAAETKGAVENLTKEAQQTVRHTASRITAAVDATKGAIKSSTKVDS